MPLADAAIVRAPREQARLGLLAFLLFVICLTLRQPVAFGGTMDGGGGNTGKRIPPTPSQIQFVVNHLSEMLAPVLQYQEIVNTPEGRNMRFRNMDESQLTESERVLKRASAKLFQDDARNAFVELNRVHFRLSSTTCQDLHAHPKDGSAFNRDSSEICLSASRLTRKLDQSNYLAELLALAAHEISHRVGANEAEARVIQASVLKSLKARNAEETYQTMRMDLYSYSLQEAIRPLEESLRANVTPDRSSVNCLMIGRLVDQVHSTMSAAFLETDKYLGRGYSNLSLHQLQAIVAADLQVGYVASYCGSAPNSSEKRGEILFLKGEGENSIEVGFDAQAIVGSAGNLEQLRFNLRELKKSLALFRTIAPSEKAEPVVDEIDESPTREASPAL